MPYYFCRHRKKGRVSDAVLAADGGDRLVGRRLPKMQIAFVFKFQQVQKLPDGDG